MKDKLPKAGYTRKILSNNSSPAKKKLFPSIEIYFCTI